MPILVEQVCRDVQKPEHAASVLAWIEQRRASYDWPGNVRELVNVASVAAALAHDAGAIDDVLTLAPDEAALVGRGAATAFSAAKREAVAAFERDYFTAALVERCEEQRERDGPPGAGWSATTCARTCEEYGIAR